MKRWRSCLIILLIAAVLAAALAVFYLSPYGFLRGALQTRLAISAPANGSAVALHSTLPVVAEAESGVGVRRLELWVNNQLWASQDFPSAQRQIRHVWAWTPSGKGTHQMLLRAVDAVGGSSESQRIEVYASAGFDVLFPMPYTTTGGETLASLATDTGADLDAISESNPGIGLNSALPPGQQLTIPVPIPNADAAAPEGGQAPELPVAPLPPPTGNPAASGQAPVAGAGIDIKTPVQQIYAYVSLAGGPWRRVPEGEFNFLPPPGDSFDVGPYVNAQWLQGLKLPVAFQAQIWGWSGGVLVHLGDQSGMLGGATVLGRELTSTKLAIVGRIRESVTFESEWTIPRPIPDYFQGYNQEFQWSVSVPGVTQGVWQVSTQPFPTDDKFGVPGFVGSGLLPAPQTIVAQLEPFGVPFESEVQPVKFEIDFANYLDLPEQASGIEALLKQLSGGSNLKRWDSSLQTTFYVRVLPILGEQVGEPSNMVIVHYGPAFPQPVTAETGPIYDVEVLSFEPFRASDPKYAACAVLQQDLQYCNPTYSLNPFEFAKLNLHMQNVLKLAANNNNLGAYKNQFPSVVVESSKCYTTMTKGTHSCGCPGVSCSSASSCSANPTDWGSCVEWGFNQLKQAAGWLSEKFEDLKNYAVDAVMKYSGIGKVCEALKSAEACRAALKTALEYGLASMGVPPTMPNLETLMEEGTDYLGEMAVQELKDQGIACDAACETAVKGGVDALVSGVKGGGTGGGGGTGTGTPSAIFKPHPLGVEQPATMRVRVTRRPETAAIPTEHTAACSLLIWNGATNTIYGIPLEGAPFIGVGMDIPPMEPGESMLIPVVLQRMAWNPPAGLTLKTASGGTIPPPTDPNYGAWSTLYYGSTITFDLRGPVFNTPGADGKMIPVSCMNTQKLQEAIAVP